MTLHLLIIEDDLDLGAALLAALRQAGFSAVWVRSLADAAAALDATVDAVLLDLGLPDGEGLDLLRRWRAAHTDVPVLVITARSALQERLAGLDSGADDVLVKPFAMPELFSRLRAVTRRYQHQASERWTLGDVVVAPSAHQAWLAGVPLELSAREFRLLLELVREPSQVVSKSLLGQRLEPLGEPVDAATIEVHLSNLRRKVGAQRIRTVRGVGYQWVG